ncbi:hypothetical protein OH738_25235 [Streptomyces hirsutus]|uniref:hypothetical protein n=1 Tax=Streptomyces hirsutus TaxID=35620 RepID=UPI003863BF01|nr:hypothetical protein OH738_25235 [Streptomyces hirsutus]
MRLDRGAWTSSPPELISDSGEWEFQADEPATGAGGQVTYQLEDPDGARAGEVRVRWGSSSADPASQNEGAALAAVVAAEFGSTVLQIEDGDDSNVTFEVRDDLREISEEERAVGAATVAGTREAVDTQRFAAIWEQSPGPSFHAMHGLTSGQYQQRFNDLVGQGFRPVHVSGYASGGGDRFAAIFEQRSGPAFQARHGLTAAQYQQTFDDLVGQGFRLVDVNGYLSAGGGDRFTAIFEQRPGPAFQARHGLTAAQYQQTFDDLVGQGFRLLHVSGYASGGGDRFAAIFEQRSGPAFQARHGLTAAQYQQTFDDLVGQGFRLVDVNGYLSAGGGDRFTAIFEQRSGPAFQARHGLTAAQYQQTFDDLVGQGFRLLHVSGYASG